MKKYLVVLLACLCLLAGCHQHNQARDQVGFFLTHLSKLDSQAMKEYVEDPSQLDHMDDFLSDPNLDLDQLHFLLALLSVPFEAQGAKQDKDHFKVTVSYPLLKDSDPDASLKDLTKALEDDKNLVKEDLVVDLVVDDEGIKLSDLGQQEFLNHILDHYRALTGPLAIYQVLDFKEK